VWIEKNYFALFVFPTLIGDFTLEHEVEFTADMLMLYERIE